MVGKFVARADSIETIDWAECSLHGLPNSHLQLPTGVAKCATRTGLNAWDKL